MIEFSNNLQREDAVVDHNKRPGVVVATPRRSKRNIFVRFQGEKTPRRVDVMKLRLVVDGRPEDTPPVTGEPPAPRERTPDDPVEILRAGRAKNKQRMDELESEFKALRIINERVDLAIKALTGED